MRIALRGKQARTNALNHRWLGERNLHILERNHSHPASDPFQQFAGPQQEFRIRRFSKALISRGESFVNEQALRRQRVDDARKQRPVQVIRDNDRVELATRKRPAPSLEVGLHYRYAWDAGKQAKRNGIAIERANAPPRAG
jgi:hypothetical protein